MSFAEMTPTPITGGFGSIVYSPQRSDQNESLKQLTDAVSEFVRNVVRVQGFLQIVGTPKDSKQTREALNSCVATTSAQMKAIAEMIKIGIASDSNRNSAQKKEQAKVIKSFMEVAETFKHLSSIASEKERQPLPTSNFPSAVPFTLANEPTQETESLMESERRNQLAQIEQERTFQDELIKDRQAGIMDLEQKVIEVNEIFRDLAALVQEQGTMIDNIEYDIERSLHDTDVGVDNLKTAERYTRKSRSRMCVILAIVGGFVAILVLIIVLSLVV